MNKILVKDSYIFMLAPNPDENNEPWLYYKKNEADEYWSECDARMGYDLDELKNEMMAG